MPSPSNIATGAPSVLLEMTSRTPAPAGRITHASSPIEGPTREPAVLPPPGVLPAPGRQSLIRRAGTTVLRQIDLTAQFMTDDNQIRRHPETQAILGQIREHLDQMQAILDSPDHGRPAPIQRLLRQHIRQADGHLRSLEGQPSQVLSRSTLWTASKLVAWRGLATGFVLTVPLWSNRKRARSSSCLMHPRAWPWPWS